MIKTKTRRIDAEGPLQRACVDHLRARFPGAIVHHSANERIGARAGARARNLGQVAGFPDIITIMPDGAVVFFEVKAPAGRVSDAQAAFMARLDALGHRCAVVRHTSEIDAALAAWGIAA